MTKNNTFPYHKYPYKVLVEGDCSFLGYLTCLELACSSMFGFPDGPCFWCDEFNASGRCPVFPQIDEHKSIDYTQQISSIYTNDEDDKNFYNAEFFDYTLLSSVNFSNFKPLYAADNFWVCREDEIYGTPSKDFTYGKHREHSHIGGRWCYQWGKKTGYDYGEQTFYFKSEEDASLFVLLCPAEFKAKKQK